MDIFYNLIDKWYSIGIVALIGILAPPVINHWIKESENNNKLGKGWKCQIRLSAQTRYNKLLVVSLLSIVWLPIVIIIILLIFLINKTYDILLIYKISSIVGIVISICILLYNSRKIKKSNGRNGMYKTKNGCSIIWEEVILIATLTLSVIPLVGCALNIPLIIGTYIIYLISILILELASFFIFDDQLEYQYKTATIFTDGEQFENIQVCDIGKRGKWIFFKTGGKEVRILQDQLYKIEYYDKQF